MILYNICGDRVRLVRVIWSYEPDFPAGRSPARPDPGRKLQAGPRPEYPGRTQAGKIIRPFRPGQISPPRRGAYVPSTRLIGILPRSWLRICPTYTRRLRESVSYRRCFVTVFVCVSDLVICFSVDLACRWLITTLMIHISLLYQNCVSWYFISTKLKAKVKAKLIHVSRFIHKHWLNLRHWRIVLDID